MARSPHAGEVDEILAALHARLKGLGFRKKGRAFNRPTEDGLVQVIGLQMGRHEPPGSFRIPFFREDLHGSFTVTLGVHVPEVARHLGGEVEGFVQEPQCCIRTRLGELGPERRDLWWRSDAAAEVVPDLLGRLDGEGLPFLERLGSRDAILREWRDATRTDGGGVPPRIVLAIILAERGEREQARRLLGEQAAEPGHPAHAEHVRSLAMRLGISLP